MIVVHHLNNSRSQRVLWLLEELGIEYEIKFYERSGEDDAGTGVAAPIPSAREVTSDRRCRSDDRRVGGHH